MRFIENSYAHKDEIASEKFPRSDFRIEIGGLLKP
jgi:hypothetical protein